MPEGKSNGPRSGYATPEPELLVLRASPPKERADAARNRLAVLDAAARLFREHGVDHVSMDAVAAAAGVGKGTLFRRFGDKAGLAVALLDERERDLQQAILTGPAPLGPGTPLPAPPKAAPPKAAPPKAEHPKAEHPKAEHPKAEHPKAEHPGAATREPGAHAKAATRRPGQPTPQQRILAFFDAYLDYVLAHLDLSRMSETASPGARYRIGAYRFWHRHLTILLKQSDTETDTESDTETDPEAVAHTLLAPIAAEHLAALVAELGEKRTRAAILHMVSSTI